MGDSLKEIEETSYWLDLLAESGIVKPAKLASLMDESSQLTAIFITIINNSKRIRP